MNSLGIGIGDGGVIVTIFNFSVGSWIRNSLGYWSSRTSRSRCGNIILGGEYGGSRSGGRGSLEWNGMNKVEVVGTTDLLVVGTTTVLKLK